MHLCMIHKINEDIRLKFKKINKTIICINFQHRVNVLLGTIHFNPPSSVIGFQTFNWKLSTKLSTIKLRKSKTEILITLHFFLKFYQSKFSFVNRQKQYLLFKKILANTFQYNFLFGVLYKFEQAIQKIIPLFPP